jgi:DNA-binding NarL/FixJ family response regulator
MGMIATRTEEQVTAVVADDSALFRSGLVGLLGTAGVDVLAEAGDAQSLERAVAACHPAVALVDVRMPPTHTDEGIDAAIRLRERFPGLGVLVLSTYAESEWVARLLSGGADRLGYLLKDRVDNVETLVAARRRVAAGGTAVDPEVVARLLTARSRPDGPVAGLTPRERDVLGLMAEGLSNIGIGRRMHLAPKTVEAHVAHIFTTLGLHTDDDTNRRVRAVVTLLRSPTP